MVKVENFFFFNKDVAQHLKEKRKKEKKEEGKVFFGSSLKICGEACLI